MFQLQLGPVELKQPTPQVKSQRIDPNSSSPTSSKFLNKSSSSWKTQVTSGICQCLWLSSKTEPLPARFTYLPGRSPIVAFSTSSKIATFHKPIKWALVLYPNKMCTNKCSTTTPYSILYLSKGHRARKTTLICATSWSTKPLLWVSFLARSTSRRSTCRTLLIK